MSSGANIGDGGPNGIGDAPVDMGAWEKFQLGWLGCDDLRGRPLYDGSQAGAEVPAQLGPQRRGATQEGAGASSSCCRDKRHRRRRRPAGDRRLRGSGSTMGDDLNNFDDAGVTHAGGAQLTAKVLVRHRGRLRLRVPRGLDERRLDLARRCSTNLSDPAGDQSGFNASGTGITGTTAALRRLTAHAAGRARTRIRFRYQTDARSPAQGFVDRRHRRRRHARRRRRDRAKGWTFAGFVRTTGVDEHATSTRTSPRTDGYTRLRHVAAHGVQLRLPRRRPDWVETLPVPGRPAGQLLGHVVRGQQRRRSPGRRPDPPGGRAPVVLPLVRRPPAAAAVLRSTRRSG